MRYVLALCIFCSLSCVTEGVYGATDGHRAHVDCRNDSMLVTFTKHAFLHNYTLQLNDTNNLECMATEGINTTQYNSTHIWISAGYYMCGAELVEADVFLKIVYHLHLKSKDDLETSSNTLVYRGSEDTDYILECIFQRNNTLSLATNVTAMTATSHTITKTAKFQVSFSIFKNNLFSNPVQTPYTISLGKTLYLQIALQAIRSELHLFPQNCFATNHPGVGQPSERFYMIKERCKSNGDQSIKMINRARTKYQFQVDSFQFRDGTSQTQAQSLYIHCDLLICLKNSTVHECSFCQSNIRRRRRGINVDDEEESPVPVKLSTGLIYVMEKDGDPTTRKEKPKSKLLDGISGTLVLAGLAFIISVLLLILLCRVSRHGCSIDNPQEKSMQTFHSFF